MSDKWGASAPQKGMNMRVEIKKNCYGYNGYCRMCGEEQEGRKPQPLVVWYIGDGEKRGHNKPVCSRECAEKLAKRMKGE